jgi:hypothetical protein
MTKNAVIGHIVSTAFYTVLDSRLAQLWRGNANEMHIQKIAKFSGCGELRNLVADGI